MDLTKYPVPHNQTAARIVDDTAIIVLADTGEVNVLNAVGSRVWTLIDGKHSLHDIATTIQNEYDVSLQEALDDLEEFIKEMLESRALILQDREQSD